MTYLELAKTILEQFTEDQQNSDVTVSDTNDEYFLAELIITDCDVLDKNHPVLSPF